MCVPLSERSLSAYLLFWEERSCHSFLPLVHTRSCATDVTDATRWLHTRQALWHTHTQKTDTIVVSGSPSIVRPSSLPWLYTGTLLTWQRQSCQNWWCRRWGPPIPFCTLFRCWYSVDHKLHQARTVLAFPLQWYLYQKISKQEDSVLLYAFILLTFIMPIETQ